MFARHDRYAAAYTHKTPSRDDELVTLAKWTLDQEGSSLVLVGANAKSLEHSSAARSLVKRGATFTYGRQRGWGAAERVIAMWPTTDILGELDAAHSVRALGVLTWNLDEVASWAVGLEAVDVLGEAPEDFGPAPITDPMLLGGLRSITNAANLSTGLSHTSDFNTALSTLKELRQQGRSLDRAAIETWAVGNGWSLRHAAGDLGALVAELNAGKQKRFKQGGGRQRTTPDLLDYWVELGNKPDWVAP